MRIVNMGLLALVAATVGCGGVVPLPSVSPIDKDPILGQLGLADTTRFMNSAFRRPLRRVPAVIVPSRGALESFEFVETCSDRIRKLEEDQAMLGAFSSALVATAGPGVNSTEFSNQLQAEALRMEGNNGSAELNKFIAHAAVQQTLLAVQSQMSRVEVAETTAEALELLADDAEQGQREGAVIVLHGVPGGECHTGRKQLPNVRLTLFILDQDFNRKCKLESVVQPAALGSPTGSRSAFTPPIRIASCSSQ